MKRFLISLIILVILIVCVVYWVQQQLLFYPIRKIEWNPRDNGMDYEEFFIDPIGGRSDKPVGESMWAWKFTFNPHERTVLFCHGNAGNISHRSYIVNICRTMGLNVLLIDYKGYGRSSSNCSVSGLYSDADIVVSYLLKNNIVGSKLIIWGESLGGAFASHIASKVPCNRLVLMATFSSLDDIVKYKSRPWLSRIISLTTNTLPSKNRLSYVLAPTLIMHSVEDELIPFQCSLVLFNSVRSQDKQLIRIRGRHAYPELTETNLRDLMRFLDVDDSKITDDLLREHILEIRSVCDRFTLL